MSLSSIRSSVRTFPRFSREAAPQPIRKVAELCTVTPTDNHYDRAICLTFDDGPDPEYTPRILDVLADFNVKATFFVLGEAAEQHPQLVERMLKAGHSIGSHAFSHRHPWVMSSDHARHEVRRANIAIEKITGETPPWFRPPFGRLRKAMLVQAQQEKMTTVLWSRSIIDWGAMGTSAGISRRLSQIKAGDIVLMHDGKREHNHPDVTVECLPKFLHSLTDKSLIACNLDGAY